MATVGTTNVSATSAWALLRTASGNETWSINFDGAPVVVAVTTTSTAPSISTSGDRIPATGKSVTLNANDRLWGRTATNRSDTQFVLTGEA